MSNLVEHFATSKEEPVTGTDFWKAE